jgi:REP element-mobilizing transposase RayT
MPQSLARLHVHLIFSTKNRVRILHNSIRSSLHAYMAIVMQNFDCPPVLINSAEDHVHILFELGRTVAVSRAVEEVISVRIPRVSSAPPRTVRWEAARRLSPNGINHARTRFLRGITALQR